MRDGERGEEREREFWGGHVPWEICIYIDLDEPPEKRNMISEYTFLDDIYFFVKVIIK